MIEFRLPRQLGLVRVGVLRHCVVKGSCASFQKNYSNRAVSELHVSSLIGRSFGYVIERDERDVEELPKQEGVKGSGTSGGVKSVGMRPW